MPQVHVHFRIDDVLCDAIEQVVRRNRLNDAAFVLRPIVAERCSAIKFSPQGHPATSGSEPNCAQHERAASHGRSELVVLSGDFSRSQKMEASDQCSFEQKNAQCEADERDQSRHLNRQTDVACAEHRPQQNCEGDDRQHHENSDRPKRGGRRGFAAREQSKHRSSNRADQKLAGNCRSDAKLFQMIVAADLAHERKERSRRNEHRKAITDNYERCSHAQRSEQQHRGRHYGPSH